VIAEVEIGAAGEIELGAEADLAETGAVEAAIVLDQLPEGEVGESGDGFDVGMAVAGFEGKKRFRGEGAVDGGETGAGAVDEQGVRVEVVVGLIAAEEAPAFGLPLRAGGDGMVVLFAGRVEGAVGAAEFAIDAEAGAATSSNSLDPIRRSEKW
jgi:hypothetical protein